MSGIILLSMRILGTIALYSFIASTLFFLWRSLQRDTDFLSSRQVLPMDILVQPPDSEGHLLHFIQSNIAIGRDPDCDVVLTHSTVSARHARLAFHHTQWWVDDLQSTNGTLLNNDPLKLPTVVVSGDTIKCGQINLTIMFKHEANPGTGEQE
jgi:hypothetical protein